jgi:hypothetical protein
MRRALAFRRSGDPNIGSFADAAILKTFGEVPENLDELWRLNSSPAAPLASHDLVSLLEGALPFAIFTRLLISVGALLHIVLTVKHSSLYRGAKKEPKTRASTAKSLKGW